MKAITTGGSILGCVPLVSLPRRATNMKRLFLLCCILALCLASTTVVRYAWAVPVTYYVDTESSGGNGTTTATSGANAAFATIAAVNAASFSAGDSILFKRGCTWRETLTVPSSGSEGNVITFGAYGVGEAPVIGGTSTISGFSAYTASGTVTKSNIRLSVVNGTAFVDFSSAGALTPYLGAQITVTDSASKTLVGYIKAAGTAQTLGDELWTGFQTGSWSASGASITSETRFTLSASPGSAYKSTLLTSGAAYVNSFDGTPSQGWVAAVDNGNLVTYSTDGASNTYFCAKDATYRLRNTSSAAGQTCDVVSLSIKQVLTPSATGVTITSTANGSTYNWASEASGFNRNDASNYSYSIGVPNVWKSTINATAYYVTFNGFLGTEQESVAALTAAGDWYSDGTDLYVYATGDPSGTIVAGTVRDAITVGSKNYVTFQGLKISGFWRYGINCTGATYVNINYCVIDGYPSLGTGQVSAGIGKIGVYLNSGNNVAIQNCDIFRNYYGIYNDAGQANTVVNSRIYANRDWGLMCNNASRPVTYSYSHLYGNGVMRALYASKTAYQATDGGNNIAATTQPGMVNALQYNVPSNISIDDPNGSDAKDDWVDAILPAFNSRSLPLSINVVTGDYTVSNKLITDMVGWEAAGHDIASHTWSHQDFLGSMDGFAIRYVGAGAACTMTISGNTLTTTVDGSGDLNIDLTSASYDLFVELIAYIDGLADYTCSLDATAYSTNHSKVLADVAAQDIKTAAYTAPMSKQRLVEDDLASTKAFIEANIAGYTVTAKAQPNGSSDDSIVTWTAAAGYEGARILPDLLQNLDTGQNAFMFGHTDVGSLHGESQATIATAIQSIMFSAQMNGVPAMLLAHPTSALTATEFGYMLDEMSNYMSMSAMFTWLRTQTQDGTTARYRVAPSTPDLHLQSGSPCINAGVDVGLTSDYAGNAIRGLPDIGAYEFQSVLGVFRRLLGVGK